MSGIYDEVERRVEESEYRYFLQQLIDGEDISGVAAELSRQVIAKGEESLSGFQELTFDAQVRRPFLRLKCSQCDDYIPFNEAYEALHGDELCGMCAENKKNLLIEE